SFGIFESMSLPDTKRQEDWRQADLKGLDLDAYAPFRQPNGAAPAESLEDVSGVLRQRGTSAAAGSLEPDLKRQGVIMMPLGQAAREHRDLVERYMFSSLRPARDKFSALHAAMFSGPFVYVLDAVTVPHPLVSQYSPAGSCTAALPHPLLIAG